MTAELLAAILRDLPNLPEEVARQWLVPHAARPDYGWPPAEKGRAEPWSLILAGRSLDWWRARQWRCETLPMTLDVMSHATRFQVARMQDAARRGRDYMPDSAQRIAAVRRHVSTTGTWPVAPVAYPDSDGLALADGHHRLAALMMERSLEANTVQARHAVWIALPCAPENG